MTPSRPRLHPPLLPNIDWRGSVAKLIVMQDLEEGIFSVDEVEVSATEAFFNVYRHMEEFSQVPFCQFSDRLRDHRQQVQTRLNRSAAEEIALHHDRRIHPRKTNNRRGEPVFDMSEAKLKLRMDVKDKVHTTMTPGALQASHPEYRVYKPKKFKEHIYQEVRRQKFLHYLELKRAEEKMQLGPTIARRQHG
jgi:hypothetical protein